MSGLDLGMNGDGNPYAIVALIIAGGAAKDPLGWVGAARGLV